MADIPEVRNIIQSEEVKFNASVASGALTRVGALTNFNAITQHSSVNYELAGTYFIATLPFRGAGPIHRVPFDATIIDIVMWHYDAGSGGTTTFDVKKATTPGGVFSTILSTLPAIASTAGSDTYVGITDSGAGLTPAVLVAADLDAGDALLVELTTVQTGLPCGTGINILYRPR